MFVVNKKMRLAALSAAVIGCLPFAASAQLEEIVVTATRRETDLQSTPLSIQAFSAEALEIGGIERGQDLGIMVPNLVANPQGGGVGAPSFYIRGLPGVGIYIDGIWQSSYGFLESNFAEVERVEVLRGPQGTLFGRNTNGGAINITTRAPGDEFGVRMNFEVGSFNRRNSSVAVDVPLSDTLKTKFMVSSFKNDGFLESLTVPRSLGNQDDQLLRFDMLWEPTDTFSLRLTANDEDKKGTEARIVRITNPRNVRYIQYNVLAGNPDYVNIPGFSVVNWGLPGNRFTPQTHMSGYPGGQLGKWQTRSDTPDNGITRDLKYYTVTAKWDITDNLSFESISSAWQMYRRQSVDFDGSQFIITTDENRARDSNVTQEFHISGSNFNDRLTWIGGLYALSERSRVRTYRWPMLDIPRSPTNPNAWRADVATYLTNWWNAAGQPTFQGATSIAANPPAFSDTLNKSEAEQKALFGEVTIGLTEKLDMTLGVRVTDDNGRQIVHTPTDGFRPVAVGGEPLGDIFAGYRTAVNENPDLGNNTTNKFGIQYQLNDDLMLYGSWSEGFTETGVQNANVPTAVNGVCPAVLAVTRINLRREVITSREFGFRSDLLDGDLRFNATYFDATWDGMRVNNLPVDPCTGAPSPNPYLSADGGGVADGFEFEVVWAATDRLRLDVNLGMINTEYTARGTFDGTNGIGPNTPFAYAPDNTASLGLNYQLPLESGASVTFAGNYGWRDQYTRDNANQRTPVDANGNYIYEPSYGVFNARVIYEPAEANWSASLWGTNLSDSQYVNGGFDTRFVWGYDFSVIGRAREAGVSIDVRF
jgi:iron complex outermembrane receptor protein